LFAKDTGDWAVYRPDAVATVSEEVAVVSQQALPGIVADLQDSAMNHHLRIPANIVSIRKVRLVSVAVLEAHITVQDFAVTPEKYE
jgi:hypothetical protein